VTLWCGTLGVVAALLFVVPAEQQAQGPFTLRPVRRAELHAPVAGFLREVYFDEGDAVPIGAPVVRVEAGDLASRIAEKRAELSEARARLAQSETEREFANTHYERALRLLNGPTAAGKSDIVDLEERRQVTRVRCEQAKADVARVEAEAHYLDELRSMGVVRTPVAGAVTTPRLRQKLGQYLHEGDPLCTIEDNSEFEAELVLSEEQVARVAAGQRVRLKARAMPFDSFTARVVRVAPAAATGAVQSNVTVYCLIDSPVHGLKPLMSGYARVDCGRRSLGRVLGERVLRYVRTEFWW
jgi:RND family efflux transporter MFP subunit